jgi:hypothetical protein
VRLLEEFEGSTLSWEGRHRRSFRLISGQDIYGTLEYERKSRRATAVAASGSWSFDWRRRFLWREASIRAHPGGEQDLTCKEVGIGEEFLSVMRPQGAVLSIDGCRFDLVPAGFMRAYWTWRSADGREVLALVRPEWQMRVELLLAASRFSKNVALLALVGAYIIDEWWPKA